MVKPFSEKRPIRKTYARNEKVYIYGLIDPRDQTLFWVGITNSPPLRYEQHYANFDEKNLKKRAFMDDLIKSGHLPHMLLIEEFDTREKALSLEKSLIGALSGVNAIKLHNIEHNPNRTFRFKKSSFTHKPNLWTIKERLPLIQSYKQGSPIALLLKDLDRRHKAVCIELARLEKAGFITIRSEDRASVNEAIATAQYKNAPLDNNTIKMITQEMIKVEKGKYSALYLDHMKIDNTIPKNK